MGAESGLRQRIRAAIRAYDPTVMIVGQPADGRTGPGRHDLYAVVRGVFVGLEVKTSTGRATPVQLDRIRLTRRAGGWAWVVRTPHAAVGAVAFAGLGPPSKGHMSDDFDFDKLFASLGKEPGATPLFDAAQQAELEELPDFGPVLPASISEEHIAGAAQANGTAAGDGEALGAVPGLAEILARAIDSLTDAVRALAQEVRTLKAVREAQTALDKPWPEEQALSGEDPEAMSVELEALLLGAGEPPPAPTEEPPSQPPSRSRKRK